MNILAIDAALDGFSAALDRDGTVSCDRSERPDALESGLARIDALLRAARLGFADLDRLAVGIGPGSFTGTRIAVSYAKALAQATHLPLVGISSYDALEPAGAGEPWLTVVRGRTRVVCARLRRDGTLQTACGPAATVLDDLLGEAAAGTAIDVAGATEDVRGKLAERGLTVRAHSPRSEVPAVAIAELARAATPSPTPHALAPDYGELPAARPPQRP